VTNETNAVIFCGAGKPLEEKNYKIDTEIDENEAIVEISLSTVCGSDVHTWLGHRPFPTPCILGHEMVGKIIQLGKKLTHDFLNKPLSVGDRITWSMTASCGDCYYCKIVNLPQKCVKLFKYGHVNSDQPPHFTGGYAKFVKIVIGSYLFKIPPDLSDKEVVPLMCAGATITSGLDAVNFKPCDYVVVQGCGALGLYACAFSKQLGCKTVIALDNDQNRLELSKEFGADILLNVNTEKDIVSKIQDITKTHGADYVIEVTGNPDVISDGIKFLRIGGSYILLGAIYPGSKVTLDSSLILTKCLNISGMHNYAPVHLKNAIELVQQSKNKYPYEKIVGPNFEFSKDGVEKAFNSLNSKESLRPAIVPN
jgi:alcohol dehydrogenase|tara:strand:- start:201 stop:1301 length:1101 start_codon:yes stop_codon:yes gene_type:complete